MGEFMIFESCALNENLSRMINATNRNNESTALQRKDVYAFASIYTLEWSAAETSILKIFEVNIS